MKKRVKVTLVVGITAFLGFNAFLGTTTNYGSEMKLESLISKAQAQTEFPGSHYFVTDKCDNVVPTYTCASNCGDDECVSPC
jgi:hypothetical protein